MTAVRLICLVMFLAIAAGCSPSPAAAPTEAGRPIVRATAVPTTATPLAVEAQPTLKSGAYYKPPGWDGVSDVNGKAFDTHAHAQSFSKGTRGTKGNDPYGLDGDHDADACETLP
jgi:hypothetical protein